MARLSWPGRLVTYKDGLPVLKTVTHPITNQARRWLTSLMRPTPLPTKPNRHLTIRRAKLYDKLQWVEWRLCLYRCSCVNWFRWRREAVRPSGRCGHGWRNCCCSESFLCSYSSSMFWSLTRLGVCRLTSDVSTPRYSWPHHAVRRPHDATDPTTQPRQQHQRP